MELPEVEGTLNPQSGVVRLLTPVKIPAWYIKTVRTKIYGELDKSLLLFTPDLNISRTHLQLPEAALEAANDSTAIVVVQNQGVEPI